MKIIKSFLIVAAALGASTLAQAQQNVKNETAKPPVATGPVLQEPAENKTVMPPPVSDKDQHQTATKQSSVVNEQKPVKAKDIEQPVVPVKPTLPPTTTLVPPNPVKYR